MSHLSTRTTAVLAAALLSALLGGCHKAGNEGTANPDNTGASPNGTTTPPASPATTPTPGAAPDNTPPANPANPGTPPQPATPGATPDTPPPK